MGYSNICLYNLESIQILCPKTLYLKNGRLKALSNTNAVIRDYVCSTELIEADINQPAQIEHVKLYNKEGAISVTFSPGESAELKFLLRCSETVRAVFIRIYY